MFHLTKKPSKERKPYLKVVCLPDSCVMNAVKLHKMLHKRRFLNVQRGFTLIDRYDGEESLGGAAGHHQRRKTVRPAVVLYLNELLD